MPLDTFATLRTKVNRPRVLLRRDVGCGEAAVDDEGRPVHVRRLVRGEEECGVRDLPRRREPSHREVHAPTLEGRRVLLEEAKQHRRLDRARAERVHPDPAARELNRELAGQREDGALRRRVGDLRRGRAHERDEGGDVDHRAAAALEQVRDAVFAAQEDALRVHVLYSRPGLGLGVEDRRVLRGHDPGVVVEDVDAAVAVGDRAVEAFDALRVGDVHLVEEGVAALGGGCLALLPGDVGDADACALGGEEERRLSADPAGRAGDDDDLALEPAAHVARKTFLTSEYPSSACIPSSRPNPDCLKPPNGVETRTDVFELTERTPVSSARATRSARAPFSVQIEPERPYGVSFAIRTASASSSNGITAATGPNTSSRATRSSFVASTSVHGNQKPGADGVSPRNAG